MSDAIQPGSRQYWGPRIWKLFHLFAELSDRPNIDLLWKNWIKQTIVILPCAKCRLHFSEYLRAHPLVHSKLSSSQQTLRQYFFEFHNAVNANTEKPIFSMEDYTNLYSNKKRDSAVSESNALLNELEHALLPLEYMSTKVYAFQAWKGTYKLLLSHLSC